MVCLLLMQFLQQVYWYLYIGLILLFALIYRKRCDEFLNNLEGGLKAYFSFKMLFIKMELEE